MIDTTAVIMIFGFFGMIGTMFIAIRWLDRRMRADMSELKTEVKTNSERLNNVESALVGVQTELKAQGERLDRMDERFDRMDARFDCQEDHSNECFGRMDKRFDHQDNRFNDRFDRQEDHSNERFNRIEERQRVTDGNVNRVQGSLDVLIGYRHTPDDAEQERTAREGRVGEPIGD